jgi:hypothetical protein
MPVVLATGYSDEIPSGAGAGFEILRKPYDTGTLGKAIIAATEIASEKAVTEPATTAPAP